MTGAGGRSVVRDEVSYGTVGRNTRTVDDLEFKGVCWVLEDYDLGFRKWSIVALSTREAGGVGNINRTQSVGYLSCSNCNKVELVR